MNSTVMSTNENDISDEVNKTISIINFIFVVFGTVGNLFTFCILMRKNLRKIYSYTRYLSALCIIDIVCLYNWNFTYIYQDIFSSDKMRLEFYSPLSCRLFSYNAYSSLQLSSWIICVIGMDRIILLIKMKKSKIKNPNNSIDTRKSTFEWFYKINPFQSTVLVLIVVSVIIYATNLFVLINNGELHASKNHTYLNKTSTLTFKCYAPEKFFKIWRIVHVLLYSLIPFCIILAQNFIIAVLTLNHSKRMKRYVQRQASTEISTHETPKLRFLKLFRLKSNSTTEISGSMRNKICAQQQTSKQTFVKNLLIFLTLSFFFTTLPSSMIYTTSLNDTFYKTNTGSILKRCLQSIQYTRHAANFLIYISTSTIIQNEIRKCFIEFENFLFKRK